MASYGDPVGQALRNLGQTLQYGFTNIGRQQLAKAQYGLQTQKMKYDIERQKKLDIKTAYEIEQIEKEKARRAEEVSIADTFAKMNIRDDERFLAKNIVELSGRIMGAPYNEDVDRLVKPDGSRITKGDIEDYGGELIGGVWQVLSHPIKKIESMYAKYPDDPKVIELHKKIQTNEGKAEILRDHISLSRQVMGGFQSIGVDPDDMASLEKHLKSHEQSLRNYERLIEKEVFWSEPYKMLGAMVQKNIDTGEVRQVVSRVPTKGDVWGEPYQDKSGNWLQKTSEGSVKYIRGPEKTTEYETWSKPYEGPGGSLLQKSSRGKVRTVVGRKPKEREKVTWSEPYKKEGILLQKSSAGQVRKIVGRKPEGKTTWFEPYRNASGDLLQKSSTGQVRIITKAEKEDIWLEPYIDERGNLVQKSTTGKIYKISAKEKPDALDKKIDKIYESYGGAISRERATQIATRAIKIVQSPATGDWILVDVGTGTELSTTPSEKKAIQKGQKDPAISTLYEAAEKGTGAWSAMMDIGSRLSGLARGPIAKEHIKARQKLKMAQRALFRALRESSKVLAFEMKSIFEENPIDPSIWRSPEIARANFETIDEQLRIKLREQRAIAVDPNVHIKDRRAANKLVTSIENFLKILGVPQGERFQLTPEDNALIDKYLKGQD